MPNDWLKRVADDPAIVSRIARQASKLLIAGSGSKGRDADDHLNRYAEGDAAIFFELTGFDIPYAKGKPPDDVPYGPGIDYMVAALRLIDPSLGAQAAVYQIDRIRERKKRSVD